MTDKKVPNGFLPTDQPDLFFEDNGVGRLKKEVWDSTDEQIDAILADYGIPSPVEWAKPGSYIQTTTRWQVEENRKKNDVVFIPVGCTELHGQHLPSRHQTRRPPFHCQKWRPGQFGIAPIKLRWSSLPPPGYARNSHRS